MFVQTINVVEKTVSYVPLTLVVSKNIDYDNPLSVTLQCVQVTVWLVFSGAVPYIVIILDFILCVGM